MAIEISPREEKQPLWQTAIFVFSLVLFLLCAGAYAALNFYLIPRGEESLKSLESELAIQGTQEQKEMKKEVLLAAGQVNDFEILYRNRLKATNLFEFLQECTHPKVSFSSFSLNLASSTASLSGQTNSFESLIQQIKILRDQQYIKSFEVSNIALAKVGGVSFNLSLTLESTIFK